MKTKMNLKGVLRASSIIILLCFSFSTKAQIPGPGPFTIWNYTGCYMEIRWDVRDASCSSVCLGSVGTIVIAAGGNFVITAAMISGSPCNSGNNCDVMIVILGPSINNFPSSYTYFSNSPSGGATENDCNNTSYTYVWSSTGTTDINIL
jgi:hypothetical protein